VSEYNNVFSVVSVGLAVSGNSNGVSVGTLGHTDSDYFIVVRVVYLWSHSFSLE
jgi:hypothetical protein